jgi:hypothetical protein
MTLTPKQKKLILIAVAAIAAIHYAPAVLHQVAAAGFGHPDAPKIQKPSPAVILSPGARPAASSQTVPSLQATDNPAADPAPSWAPDSSAIEAFAVSGLT